MLASIFRLWLNGGALVLTMIVFISTGSLWSLALLVPWFVIARIMARLDR